MSRSQRVLWLLEELELPYEIIKYERDPKTLMAPPSLRAIHPLGKSPVVVDDGARYAESGAILEHLVDRHGNGRLVPARGTPEYRDFRYFMHYAEGSLMPYLFVKLIFGKLRSGAVPFVVRPITRMIADKVSAQLLTPNLTRHLEFLDDHLKDRAWFAGAELTIADIQMSYPLEALVLRSKGLPVSPRITDVLARMQARPAYQRALAKGGPVMFE